MVFCCYCFYTCKMTITVSKWTPDEKQEHADQKQDLMLMLIHSVVCFSSNCCLMWRVADFEACREEEAKLQSSSDSSQEHGPQTAQEMRLARAGLVSYARIRSRPLRLYFPSLPCFPRLPSRADAHILEESLLISQTAFYSHFRTTYQFDTSIEIQEDF